MKVTFRGLYRNCGRTTLVDTDLSEQRREHGIHATDDGVEISWDKGILQLNGNYRFTLALSRKDVARLFVEAFDAAPLNEVLGQLEGARAKRTPGQADLPARAAA